LSEAARVFDADLLRGIIGELLDRLPPIARNGSFDEIKGIITLVDGTLLPALPNDDENNGNSLHLTSPILDSPR
jgi:hypothetical protein